MNRKEFIADTCILSLGIVAGLNLTGCANVPVYKPEIKERTLSVDASAFKKNKVVILQHSELRNSVLLVKAEEGYVALLMRCTHHNKPLVATRTGLFCNAHGSSFNFKGKATKAPAVNPLRTFNVTEQDHHVLVHLD